MFGKKKTPEPQPTADPHVSSSEKPDGDKAGGLPEGIAPKSLPKPDGLRKLPPSTTEPGANDQAVLRPKKEKKEKKGCGCSGLVFGCLLLLIVIGVAGIAWMIKPFNAAGFAQVKAARIELSEAPSENSLYFGLTTIDSTSDIGVEVGFIAATVELSGIYRENVYVRGLKVHCASGTVFEKELEVFAVDFHNEGEVKGDLKGQIVRQRGIDDPAKP